MAYYIRDQEIVPVAIPIGKRVKIGKDYIEPLGNYIANDQLWIQDIYTFNNLPWYAIRNRYERYLTYLTLWFAWFVIAIMLARYLGE
jgi:hypothetical protein